MQLDTLQAHIKQTDALVVMGLGLHGPKVKQLRTHAPKLLRQSKRPDEEIVTEQLGNGLFQQVQPQPLLRRNPNPLRHTISIALDLRLDAFKQIHLVVNLQYRQLMCADLGQHRQHLLNLLITLRLVSIDDMQQQIGVARFFERRPERLDQLVRQMTNEAHRISNHYRPQVIQIQTTQGGIKRSEKLVRSENRRLGQRVEQRGLASVGVAHQGYKRNISTSTASAGLLTLTTNLFQPLLDLADTHTQQAPVSFKLCLARTAQTNTTLLPFKVSPAAHQSRAHVIQLSQLNLQLAFVRTRALGKDIQDQSGPIKHTAFERSLEVALLAGRQGVIENDQLDLAIPDKVMQLFDFATADQKLGGRLMPGNSDEANCFSAS